MIFAAHQPNLLPWLPFWVKVDCADVFGVMGHAQYSKGQYHNRVRIPIRPDQHIMLTVPVSVKLGQTINEVVIAPAANRRKLSEQLRAAYGCSRYWHDYGPQLLDIVDACVPGAGLANLTIVLFFWLAKQLQISTGCRLVIPAGAGPSENLAIWAAEAGCSTYLSGAGAATYLEHAPFAQRGITIKYSRPVIDPKYASTSALTALFDLGSEWRSCITQKGISDE